MAEEAENLNKPKWTIYVQPKCAWSEKALALLKTKGETNIETLDVVEKQLEFKVVRIGEQKREPKYAFTPLIFKDDVLIGNYVDLEDHFKRTPINIGGATY